MSDVRLVVDGRHRMLVAAELVEVPSALWFDADEWRRGGAVAIETSGRGEVLIVPHGNDTWVLRHYRRGGFVSRFGHDFSSFWGCSRKRFRESSRSSQNAW